MWPEKLKRDAGNDAPWTSLKSRLSPRAWKPRTHRGFSTFPPSRRRPLSTHEKKNNLTPAAPFIDAPPVRWDGKRGRLYFQTRPGSYGAESLILFLKDLRRHFRGQQVILVWDGLPAHKSCLMKTYLQSQRRWLKAERLPGYAPDLNPVETLWSNIKGQELANRCSANLAEAAAAVCQGMARVRCQAQQLAFSFLDHAGLSF